MLYHPLDQLATIRAIYPDQRQLFACATHTCKQQSRTRRVGYRCRCDHDDQHQAQCVHQQVALASVDVFAFVIATHSWYRASFDALAVQTASSRMLVTTGFASHSSAQGVVNAPPGAVITPHAKGRDTPSSNADTLWAACATARHSPRRTAAH